MYRCVHVPVHVYMYTPEVMHFISLVEIHHMTCTIQTECFISA